MTKIPNVYMISKNEHSKPVLVIEYWNLKFICNLLARRLSGGVLVVWDFKGRAI